MSQTIKQFSEAIRAQSQSATQISPIRFSAASGIDFDSLAAATGVTSSALRSAPFQPSVQRYLKDAVRVIEVGADIGGDLHKALNWFRCERLSVFDEATAMQLVAQGRTEDLLRYMNSLYAGAAG